MIVSIFAGIDAPALGYACAEYVSGEQATHVVLAKQKRGEESRSVSVLLAVQREGTAHALLVHSPRRTSRAHRTGGARRAAAAAIPGWRRQRLAGPPRGSCIVLPDSGRRRQRLPAEKPGKARATTPRRSRAYRRASRWSPDRAGQAKRAPHAFCVRACRGT